MNEVNLTKALIKSASYVDENTNERIVGEFIISYAKSNLRNFKIIKQPVDKKRFNVIIFNDPNPVLIFFSHMDTVFPTGNIRERLTPKLKDGKLTGLGAVDMKGGMACSLIAVSKPNRDLPLALVLTCDEEYYFAGIKKFISEFKTGKSPISNLQEPSLVIFPEPSDLKISYGCRGCVELEVLLEGKTAHAGKPKLGVNAVEKTVELISILKNKLADDLIPLLGKTTVNLASLIGGVGINNEIISRANAIPDKSKFVLDIRTASKDQVAEYISKQIRIIAENLNVKVLDIEVKLDQAPYIADKKNLNEVESSIKKSDLKVIYSDDLSNSGYGEFAMIGAELGWNAINFGPGPSSSAHQINEFVNIKDLNSVAKMYSELIKLLKEKS